MAQWIQIIVLIFRYGPTIVGLIKELLDALDGAPEPVVSEATKDVEKAARRFAAKRSRRELRSELRAVVDRVRSKK